MLLERNHGQRLVVTVEECAKAAVVAAHALGWLDRVVSLDALAEAVGVRPNPALRSQFTEARMGQWRTSLMLGGPI